MVAHSLQEDREVRQIANALIGRELGSSAVVGIDVRLGRDSGGDEALVITAHLDAHAPLLNAALVDRLERELNDALIERGQNAFTYLRWRRDGEQPVDDSEGDS